MLANGLGAPIRLPGNGLVGVAFHEKQSHLAFGQLPVATVDETSRALAIRAPLPEGYRYEWGGQYRNQQTALRRLALLVPLAIGAIYLLLYLAFGSFAQGALIMTNVPFALAGGIALLWLRELNMSTSAIIGFIAVFGIAVLNGVVLVSYMNDLRARGRSLREAMVEGAFTRLRPVLMTASAATLGFIPMALSHSPGSELQRPLATVVIGGLVTATALTLLVPPTAYGLVEEWRDARSDARDRVKARTGFGPEPTPAGAD